MDAKRIKYLRGELEAERISYGELHEIECAADSAGLDVATMTEQGALAGDLLDAIEERQRTPTHTPTPWIASGNRIYMGAAMERREIAVATKADPSIRKVANENAQFIVHAVNCHDELLDLVRRAFDRFTDNDMQPPNQALKVWLDDASAALAKAEGGAS